MKEKGGGDFRGSAKSWETLANFFPSSTVPGRRNLVRQDSCAAPLTERPRPQWAHGSSRWGRQAIGDMSGAAPGGEVLGPQTSLCTGTSREHSSQRWGLPNLQACPQSPHTAWDLVGVTPSVLLGAANSVPGFLPQGDEAALAVRASIRRGASKELPGAVSSLPRLSTCSLEPGLPTGPASAQPFPKL